MEIDDFALSRYLYRLKGRVAIRFLWYRRLRNSLEAYTGTFGDVLQVPAYFRATLKRVRRSQSGLNFSKVGLQNVCDLSTFLACIGGFQAFGAVMGRKEFD